MILGWDLSDPLTVLDLGLLVLAGCAFVDCVRQDPQAFPAAGKLTKPAWLAITGVALLFALLPVGVLSLFGAAVAVASIVYLVDVKPAVTGMRPGSGPYG
ncbi:MAG: uncharacterized protein JWM64_2711 [Frankiales bacterium]|nr:uncharacterized protein [Frankiales bacterium]